MRTKNGMNRRRFLKTSAVSIAGAGLLYSSKQGFTQEDGNAPAVKIKEYRILGRTGFKASDIAVGKPYNAAVLRALLDAGVNYIDTGESYGRGQSEKVIGEVIKDRDRKSLFITSKLSMRGNPGKEQVLSRARKCLERLRVDYLDCMMIHSCPNVESLNYQPFHDAMNQLKKEGKLRFIGMSNHGGNYNDVPESMEKVHLAAIKDGRYDVLLLVYNFLKRDMGEKILKACRGKNIGTVLMKVNPVGSYHAYKARLEEAEKKGEPTERLQGVVARLKKRVELAQDFIKKHRLTNNEAICSAAYRFVLDNKDAHCALFHFTNFDQVDSVLSVSGTRFSSKDQKTLSALSRGCGDLYCRHACGICESKCPAGVPVNTIMRYNHYYEAQMREKYAVEKYASLLTAKADRCFQCNGMCENACPYGVPIHGLLLMAHSNLTLG
jgi:predicted aldo/keto reductase-like oxidoreductase